jgi:hypothetical protein
MTRVAQKCTRVAPTITISMITARSYWTRSLRFPLLFPTLSIVVELVHELELWGSFLKSFHFHSFDILEQRASQSERYWTKDFSLDLMPAARNDTLVLFSFGRHVRYCAWGAED